MNERRPGGDDLDRRIDQALRRRFAAPAELDTLAQRALQRRSARRRSGPALLFLCAGAAALVLLGLWAGTRRAPPAEVAPGRRVLDSGSPTGSVAVARDPGAESGPGFCQLAGPPERSDVELRCMQSPDLALLYRNMDACQRSAAAATCDDEVQLVDRLRAAYGPALELRPEAAALLHGPFRSDEWTTGTILTGSSENQTAVLVAERHTTLACCVRMNLPPDSGLRLFTWQVGDLVLTEITPLAEPRLLACFE